MGCDLSLFVPHLVFFRCREKAVPRDCGLHYENMPIQIYWKFLHQKPQDFSEKNSDIFHISAQNIDYGY